MDWQQTNRWVNMGANIAVLAGILLVVVELRQNTAMVRAQISQSRIDNVTASYRERIHSDYWPTIMAKQDAAGSREEWIASLTREEFHRLRYYVLAELNDVGHQFYQYRSGNLDPALYDSSTQGQIERLIPLLAAVLPAADIRTPGFRDEINRIAAEAGLPPLN